MVSLCCLFLLFSFCVSFWIRTSKAISCDDVLIFACELRHCALKMGPEKELIFNGSFFPSSSTTMNTKILLCESRVLARKILEIIFKNNLNFYYHMRRLPPQNIKLKFLKRLLIHNKSQIKLKNSIYLKT